MQFEAFQRQIEGIPFIMPELARDIYDFILEKQPRQCRNSGSDMAPPAAILPPL